ncbi:Cro/C1-type helix-turn-helix domain protein [Vibrio phage MZH0603]|nr:Cro/C1-type helix-turn-helix domain protein [Vibrio phage MZH0603]
MKYTFDLGRAFNTLKAQKGITNKDIAKAIQRTETTVSQWINGHQVPSILMCQTICMSFNVIFSDFIIWGESHE